MNPLPALTAALLAYVEWVRWQREREVDQLEDEIDRLAAIGDAASKLRIERLAQRRKRKLAVRPTDHNPAAG
jgi:cytochrome c-type biogenesis protein CcmH/NrfG